MTEQRRLRRHSVLVRRSLALGMSGVDVSPLLKTTLAHEDQTWWRVTHAGAFTLGGLFFWIGTFLYYYPDASAFGFDELKLSAWLYIVGSCFFLYVDVQEYFTFTEEYWLRTNISVSITGSTLVSRRWPSASSSPCLCVSLAVAHAGASRVFF